MDNSLAILNRFYMTEYEWGGSMLHPTVLQRVSGSL